MILKYNNEANDIQVQIEVYNEYLLPGNSNQIL